jgi:putative membrane protein
MLNYDRDNWWRNCFAWPGTVLPSVLGLVGLLTAFCLVLYLVNTLVLLPNNIVFQGLDASSHTVLGIALSMLLVFRTNSSNNRFWEARSHWGMLVNTSRNLVRLGAQSAPPADDLARLTTAYVILVKEQLRDQRDLACIQHLVSGRVLERLRGVNNPAQVLASFLTGWVVSRRAERRIEEWQGARMEWLIDTLLDSQGGCEKIHRTPLPFVYATLMKQVLFVYLITLPFVLLPRMDFMAPLAVAVVALGLLGIEEAGVEVEDPFGLEPNHLPLDQICATIGRDVADLTSGDQPLAFPGSRTTEPMPR